MVAGHDVVCSVRDKHKLGVRANCDGFLEVIDKQSAESAD